MIFHSDTPAPSHQPVVLFTLTSGYRTIRAKVGGWHTNLRAPHFLMLEAPLLMPPQENRFAYRSINGHPVTDLPNPASSYSADRLVPFSVNSLHAVFETTQAYQARIRYHSRLAYFSTIHHET